MARITKEEKEWRAESDAYTLISAEAIKGDPTRKRAALQKVRKIASEKEKEAKAAKKVVGNTSKSNKKRK